MNQLLNYYSFLRKKHEMVEEIIDSFVQFSYFECLHLNRHYGSQKLSHDEFRDYLVKYLIQEGLKCYKIPLPPVLSVN